ncbi:hypothetical protein [Pedobacter mucosus]|uniref:hypothetical protein n=1 Tax=Pedobacter mucosus TaxID=2895286 RepID=UPI001EE3C6FE|nr:hypothetical protein [Pedobacter mucosus]UKT65460.1 hypothetical protein LOK61_06650 [Pedobacter mucosus]
MTTFNFRQALIDIAIDEREQTQIAKVIAYYYPKLDFGTRELFFEGLLSLYQLSKGQDFNFQDLSEDFSKDEELIDTSKYHGKDFRLKNVKISNLRGIPDKEELDGITFGIDLINENNQQVNALILANNGAGKSSIFSGLEMVYAQEIGEKKLRSRNENNLDFEEYLKRFPSENPPECIVETNEGIFSLDNPVFKGEYLRIFNPIAHFITEYDVIENGRINYDVTDKNFDYSFHNIVAKSLGLKEYLDFIAISEQIPTYNRRKEVSLKNSLQTEVTQTFKIIQTRKDDLLKKSEDLFNLKNGEVIQTKSDFDSIKALTKLLERDFSDYHQNDVLQDLITDYKELFRAYLSRTRSEKLETEKTFLLSGLELLTHSADCPFCLNSNFEHSVIAENVDERLKKLNVFEEIERDIKNTYRNLSGELAKLINKLVETTTSISAERIEIARYPSLDLISKKEDLLFVRLSLITADEQLYDYIQSLSRVQFPREEDYEKLFSLVNENSDLFLKTFTSYLSDIKELGELRKLAINNEIQKLGSSEVLSIEKQIINAEIDLKELEDSTAMFQEQYLKQGKELEKAIRLVEDVENVKTQIKQFNIVFNEKKDSLVAKAFLPMKNIIEDIMNDFIDEKHKIKFQIKIDKELIMIDGTEYHKELIIASILNLETGKVTTPDIYFNTFRYKLFCLMISLSIALATRKEYNINLPLVMDDLFFSSDYVNKNSFSSFFQKIIKLFYKYTPELPFQFILFTHDDLIFRSAIDAVDDFKEVMNEDLCIENTLNLNDKTYISRMFSTDDKVKDMSILNDGSRIWELLYRIPNKININ